MMNLICVLTLTNLPSNNREAVAMSEFPKYAKNTTIPYQRSLEQIEKLLNRYGATKFAYFRDDDLNLAGFACDRQGRRFRFTVPLPDRSTEEFQYVGAGFRGKEKRSSEQSLKAWEKAVNQRYRAVLAVIKAKLIAIDEGIATFESEFLNETLIPGTNQTVGEWADEQLQQGYLTGKIPPLLPSGLQ